MQTQSADEYSPGRMLRLIRTRTFARWEADRTQNLWTTFQNNTYSEWCQKCPGDRYLYVSTYSRVYVVSYTHILPRQWERKATASSVENRLAITIPYCIVELFEVLLVHCVDQLHQKWRVFLKQLLLSSRHVLWRDVRGNEPHATEHVDDHARSVTLVAWC